MSFIDTTRNDHYTIITDSSLMHFIGSCFANATNAIHVRKRLPEQPLVPPPVIDDIKPCNGDRYLRTSDTRDDRAKRAQRSITQMNVYGSARADANPESAHSKHHQRKNA